MLCTVRETEKQGEDSKSSGVFSYAIQKELQTPVFIKISNSDGNGLIDPLTASLNKRRSQEKEIRLPAESWFGQPRGDNLGRRRD